MQTKVHFFKSYSKLGWWAARLPLSAGQWDGHAVESVGFGTTTNQAERDLIRKEQELGATAEIAA